jgi:hypothetical protein
MAWTPALPFAWHVNGINNVYPVYAMLHYLTLIIPSDVVQKILLTSIVFSLFYVPYKYLPYLSGILSKVFASGVFALNIFVYARIISGQWFHLFAYALLPFLFYTLKNICDEPHRKNTIQLTLSLFLISLLSVHILYLALIFSFLFICFHILKSVFDGKKSLALQILKSSAISVFVFIFISSWWVMPAILRVSPTEAIFDPIHYSAFSASGNSIIPVEMNTMALGGFWGEDLIWGYYFFWPQQTLLFWVSAVVLWIFVVAGLFSLFKNKNTRSLSVFFLLICIASWATSLGYADTIFKSFNLFLYTHIPLWSGLRDSNKIVSLLALMYALLSGLGVSYISQKIKNKIVKYFVAALLLCVPIIFGMHMWWGLGGQLKPVNYPADWYEAKKIIDALPKEEKVLILPWHSYLSLPFNSNRVTANPTEHFFGAARVVMSRGVDFDDIHDQESDAEYRELDTLMKNAVQMNSDTLKSELQSRNITHILIITNPNIPDSEKGLTYWQEYSKINEGETPANDKTWSDKLFFKETVEFTQKNLVLKKF